MLDIAFIRKNKDLIKEGAKKKHIEVDIDRLLLVDDERRKLLASVEEKRAEQNSATARVSEGISDNEKTKLIASMKGIKEALQKEEKKLREIMDEWKSLMLKVPNMPSMSVPAGGGEEDNVELKKWGTIPKFDFEPKNHIELMEAHDMVDFKRGVKVHGFRGYFLKNDGANLSWAIWNYGRDFFQKKNFAPFIAPAIVKREYFYGTGHLPGDANDLYQTQDEDYLAGTSEVAMMAYHADEILKKEELPKRYLAFSPCYRREAGSHGKDTKGLVRVHEFYKLEQLILCEATHKESEKLHEELNRNTEEFVESLELPYRQLEICAGDLKSAHVRSYDTELWVPSEGKYREIGSASYYHDFQSRRFNIRYSENNVNKYVHSLNATAIPTPRVLVSLIENNQQANGSIVIPKVLQSYFGKKTIE